MPALAIAGFGAAGSIFSGILGANASRKAAQQLAQAGQRAANIETGSRDWANSVYDTWFGQGRQALQNARGDVSSTLGAARGDVADLYNKAREGLNPYAQRGTEAFNTLADLLKPGGQLAQSWDRQAPQFNAPTGLTEQNDPGFQARLQMGTDALQRSAAARGGLLTGGTGKALNQFAQDYASNEFGNVFQRAQTGYQNDVNKYLTDYSTWNQNNTNLFNRLGTVSRMGQNATLSLADLFRGQAGTNAGLFGQEASLNAGLSGQESNLDENYARAVGGNIMGTAQNVGNDYMGIGNAQASGTVGAANAYGSMFGGISNSLNLFQLLNMMKQQGGGTAGADPFGGGFPIL